MEEISKKLARRVYLITYSRADLEKFPTRESFGNAVAEVFRGEAGKSVAFPTHWACCLEKHQDGASHYHVSLALNKPKRWYKSKIRLQEMHCIVVHFSENDGGYHSAYRYVRKNDTDVVLSPGHPDLSDVGSPATKKGNARLLSQATKRHFDGC